MDIELVVVRAFGEHVRGDVISAPDDIARILNGEHAAKVVRVLVAVKEI